jgi:hypothetical protein
MGKALGFVGLLVVLGVGMYLYKQQLVATAAPGGTAANPRMTIDTAGVKNDLVAIGSAERRRFASDGKYVDIGDLISNGDISMQQPSRGPFSYSSNVTDSGFTITATYSGNDPNAPKTMSINQDMQLSVQ